MDSVLIHRVLLYGRAETRRRLVLDALAAADRHVWSVLAETARSSGPWQLRARCLEALGVAAGAADEALAECILQSLFSVEPAARARPEGEPEPVLTLRQREVARLIARGLSNRAIAEELGIARGTVGIHVQHLLEKFGVSSRAAIGGWVGSQPDLNPK